MQFATFDKSLEYTLALQFSFLRERPKFLQSKKPLRIGTHPCFRSPSHSLESLLGTEATFSVSIRKADYSDEENFIVLSSGKDSAWTLHVLRQQGHYEIAGLLTTFNETVDRVTMHAVRRELVERQAAEAGLPLWQVGLPWPCSNAQYQNLMAETCAKALADGIEGIAFGDLFLEDVRAYRQKQLKDTGLEPIFPLWGQATRQLANEMIAAGMRAKLTCIDPSNSTLDFWHANLTTNSSLTCRAEPIHAERRVSFTPSSTQARC